MGDVTIENALCETIGRHIFLWLYGTPKKAAI